MSQAVLSPNLTKKFQWEVSQIADKERSLFLPLLANQFDVLELLRQEIHRYWQRGAHVIAACWLPRNESMQNA